MASENMKPVLYALNVSAFRNGVLFERAYSAVSLMRKEKIGRLHFERDKRLSLGAGLLLEYALRSADIEDREILIGENGKPYIKSGGVCLGIAHSGEMAILAIAPFPVGCDIELIAKPNIGVAKRFFSESEYADILSSADSAERFYRYWVLKESFIKATGKGLKTPLSSFTLSLGSEITAFGAENADKYYFCEINGIAGYKCAVCGEKDCRGICLQPKTPEEILSEMGI